MNRLLRTLTIVAVITLFDATLAPAQRGAPPEQPGSDPPQAAPRNVAPLESAIEQPPNTFSRGGRSTGYSRSSGYRTSPPYGTSSSRYRSSIDTQVSRSKRQVFVIPAAEIEREDHLAIERDIHVMSHIFDRVLRSPVNKIGGVFTVMGDFFGRDSHVTQVIYADGYGAMFFMDVDFALVGPPPTSEAKEPNMPNEQVDTAWTIAERELWAPASITRNSSGSEYDAEKVEMLKRNLVETLKHAANIRALKSDESVILTIVGKAIAPAAVARRGSRIDWVFSSGTWIPASNDSTAASHPSIPPSVLTIRAKKSDIDAFSKGDLDFDAFYTRTQLLANWSGTAGTMVNGKYSESVDAAVK